MEHSGNSKVASKWIKTVSAEDHKEPIFVFRGFNPSETILPKGHQRFPDRRPLPCDIVFEQDSAVKMRDGISIYTDVFRLPHADKVPAIICWSPYGKTGNGIYHYPSMAPFNAGVTLSDLSGYEKFEGLCPAEWCPRGYAVVNPDARGAFKSEGDTHFWGQQEAEDVYDLISWITAQSWCNGSVCMAGNSWLAMAQINHAARCPHPSLKCIAPWEAASDFYRDFVMRGGIGITPGFTHLIMGGMAGEGQVENIPALLAAHPLYNEYWASKRVPVERISIPTYGLASYSTALHTHGSFRTYREAGTSKKWLRVHPYQEWHDLYIKENMDDLQRFFDFYTKGVENGWENETPPVRLTLLEYHGSKAKQVLNRPESTYPLERTRYETLYLDSDSEKLVTNEPSKNSSNRYLGSSLDSTLDFTFTFDKYTELAGYSKVVLYMHCDSSDDMNVVVQLRKLDEHGQPMSQVNYPVPVGFADIPPVNTVLTLGPQGCLRASHACSYNSTKSTAEEPFYDHDRSEPIEIGKIVRLEIGLWPWGAVFTAGEGLMLRISGHNMAHPDVELIRPQAPEIPNNGNHFVHTGPLYPSTLTIPLISE